MLNATDNVSKPKTQLAVVGKKIGQKLGIAHRGLRILKVFCGEPLPVSILYHLRRLVLEPNALNSFLRMYVSTGHALNNKLLAEYFGSTRLGEWSLSAQTLNFIEERINEHVPQFILEFGSGISTVCLAQYMREVHGSLDVPRVLSVEHSPNFADNTLALLCDLGLEQMARIVCLPLTRVDVEDTETVCYDLQSDMFRQFLGDVIVDMVLIDGPISAISSRFATIPLVRDFVRPGTVFFLDDALRDAELRVGHQWSSLPYIHVEGVYMVGKGLLVGQFLNGNE